MLAGRLLESWNVEDRHAVPGARRGELRGPPPGSAVGPAALGREGPRLDRRNKRLGWHACATFLEINGIEVTTISNDDV